MVKIAMVYEQVKKLRKLHKKNGGVSNGPIGDNFNCHFVLYGEDWSDCLLLFMERLDELRQFVLDDGEDDQKETVKEIRAAAIGLRHIERELKSSIYETLL